jgi:predicted transcriptional regulator
VGDIEKLTRLLFELSNLERMKILLELEKTELKLSQISRMFELSIAETSRHLQRLSDAKLIQKKPGGPYEITEFGNLALLLLEDLGFVSAHLEYFQEHDISGIPRQFIDRIGELKKGVCSKQTIKNLEEGENKIREAREFVWILSDDVLSNTIPALMEKVKGSFDLRIILPEGKFPPENVSRLSSNNERIQKRVLPKVNVIVVMTEKYAICCFPNKSGRMDYTGFVGKDAQFHNWCKELFLHYWTEAKNT